MLDKIRAALLPSSLRNERAVIQAKLEVLYGEREALRLAHGKAAQSASEEVARGGSQVSIEKNLKAMHAALVAKDEEVQVARDRRREIDNLIHAPGAYVSDMGVDVVMPAELVSTEQALAAARDKRHQLIKEHRDAQQQAAKTGRPDRGADKRHDDIAAIEDKISQLRIRRENLAQPYQRSVRDALAPKVAEAAVMLERGAAECLAALDLLHKVNAIMPAAVPAPANFDWQRLQQSDFLFARDVGGALASAAGDREQAA